jgi:hypothetical protein
VEVSDLIDQAASKTGTAIGPNYLASQKHPPIVQHGESNWRASRSAYSVNHHLLSSRRIKTKRVIKMMKYNCRHQRRKYISVWPKRPNKDIRPAHKQGKFTNKGKFVLKLIRCRR